MNICSEIAVVGGDPGGLLPVTYLRGASKSEKYNKWYKSIARTA